MLSTHGVIDWRSVEGLSSKGGIMNETFTRGMGFRRVSSFATVTNWGKMFSSSPCAQFLACSGVLWSSAQWGEIQL
jgi:hypothetical protein